jgi:hypothetical protein
MILETNVFYNFIEAYFDLLKDQDYVTLKQAYTLYKDFCEESGVKYPLGRMQIRKELHNYFESFDDRGRIDGAEVRSIFEASSPTSSGRRSRTAETFSLVMEETKSLLDEEMADQPAQLAKADETPAKKWSSVKTKLSDIDTGELHYLKVPESHIVIDFDLKDLNGARALERNLEAASQWPSTYGEVSKSRSGIHLHYTYEGDSSELASTYSDGIEVKVFAGDASLRRKLSRCNAVPISSISSGLPLKEKKLLKAKTIASEQGLRELIERNLRKEIHPGTKPSVDFIKKILDDAYESGMKYDVSDLKPRLISFAANSTNQSGNALNVVTEMKWASENPGEDFPADHSVNVSDERIVFFDVEVYPNLFVVCWKFHGDPTVVRMINPKAHEVEALFKLKLVGFYNRRFDNHILYAASLGASPAKLYRLVQKLVVENDSVCSLRRRVQPLVRGYLGLLDRADEPQEVRDQARHPPHGAGPPVGSACPRGEVASVEEYCVNDVIATEAVFEDRQAD